nr:penicillin-binding protein [Deinococcus peraridilitoris]
MASPALAVPRLGEALPPHPWQTQRAPLELVVVYSHDCGDLGALWKDVLQAGVPVRAVNAEGVTAPAPGGVNVWRGEDATRFSRELRVRVYPSILLVREGRILSLWEGTIDLKALRELL